MRTMCSQNWQILPLLGEYRYKKVGARFFHGAGISSLNKSTMQLQGSRGTSVAKWQHILKAYNCAGFDDTSLNCSSWISNSSLRGHRRTYLTILKRAWSANFKMVWYILLRPLRPELDGRPSFSWSNFYLGICPLGNFTKQVLILAV
jgi:hypothetical protein